MSEPSALPGLRYLSSVFWIVTMAVGLNACQEEDYRGVLLAKFNDGSGHFIKRIAVSSIDGPGLTLVLQNGSKHCELSAPVPVGALSGTTDCKEISGVAFLRCNGESEHRARWQMTSCHSGFGRSVEGDEPAFLFGFSGNAYTAANQLELAAAAKFEAPANTCLPSLASNPPGECHAGDMPSLPELLALPVLSK